MPKVTVAHGEQVRQRVLHGALRAFADRGLHEATMQDVVRESGLSVGAIYTYFSGKDELMVATCELALDRELQALAAQLGGATSVRGKIELSVAFWFDFLDRDPGQVRFLAQVWAAAVDDEEVRQMLQRRRERLFALGMLFFEEGVAAGELRANPHAEALLRGFSAMIDGMILQRIEEGAAWRRGAAERRVLAWVELLFGVGG